MKIYESIGLWRTGWLWRFYGLVLFMSIRYTLNNAHTIEHILAFPLGFLSAGLAGLLLLIWGPRLITLIIAAVCSYLAFVPIIFHDINFQIAEEYTVFLILPVLALILTIIAKNQEEADQVNVAAFRVTLLAAMFFAGFHKFNYDFLNPSVSCAPGIMGMLAESWNISFPAFILDAHPIKGIVGELLVPVLLLCSPRIGIVYALGIFGLIGHVGPVPLTLLMICMTCSFFRHEDEALLREGLVKRIKRDVWWLLVFILGVSTYSANAYKGVPVWQMYFVFQTIIILLGYVMFQLLLQSKEKSQPLFPRLHLKDIIPTRKVIRTIFIVYLCLFVFNGMAPYLGLKFRMSFAMLSNLRVDDARWNSVLIPKWVSVFKKQTHIHVAKVRIDQEGMNILMQWGLSPLNFLQEGLYTPMNLKYYLNLYRANNIQLNIGVQGKEKIIIYENAANNEELWQWLNGIKDSKMFQKYLTANGPQACWH